jgi:hypothetical protein
MYVPVVYKIIINHLLLCRLPRHQWYTLNYERVSEKPMVLQNENYAIYTEMHYIG